MKYLEFRKELYSICGKVESTEKYLRQLLGQINLYKDEKPTDQLLLKLFDLSLEAEPVEFDDDWYKIKETHVSDLQNLSEEDHIEFTLNTIKFFIADLRRMEGKELENPYRSGGITSSSGARWHNFTMPEFVQAVFWGYSSESDSSDIEVGASTWTYIALILIVGKVYE